jgi:uncharacterized protein YbjQ (UPF0145 family)
MDVWIAFLPILVLVALGYGVGTYRERRHLKSLDMRENALAGLTVTNLKTITEPETVQQAALVSGDAVIASDYFKTFAASLRNIIGGEVKTYETLMTRARREATLRMLDEAKKLGATEVWNVRYETSNIRSASGGSRNKAGAASVEVFAFGTAVLRN